jgi:hypothetical protein
LSLQRSAGNRAVRQLIARGGLGVPPLRNAALARQPTAGQAKAGQAKAEQAKRIKLTFVPDKPMSAHEFAVRTWMQFFRIGAAEAERRVTAAEQGDGPGHGPHYEHGVTPEEVGKAIAVGFDLPGQTPDEVADEQVRAGELKSLPAAERRAIDLEADRRFWARTGLEPGKKLTGAGSDAGDRELWMRTRDEVVRDRNQIEALPTRIHTFLLPDGKQLTPEQYGAVLRIADKLKDFTDDDWALYTRRVNASTDDYAQLEASLDRFRAQQEAEGKVVHRVAGTESLYAQVRAWEKLDKDYHQMGVGGGATPSQSPQFSERYQRETAALDQALHTAGFTDIADYNAACHEYLLLFEKRATELALLAMRASEQTVRAELAKYQTAAGGQAAFDQLAHLRELWTQLLDASRRAEPTHHMGVGGGVGWDDPRTTEQAAAHAEWEQKDKELAAERSKQSEQSPILKDPNLLTGVLASTTDATTLGDRLRSDAEDRLADIIRTRTRVIDDAETVLQFDNVVALTLRELGAGPGSIGELIVTARQSEIASDGVLKAFALAVLAIGLGLLTFGTGTVAVLAGAGVLGLSIYQAGDELEKYSNASAAAHTAFDPTDALSSEEPTALWLALSLVAIGFDGAGLVGAMRAAAPAAKVFAETGDVVKFETTLAKATELSEGVQKAMARSARAEEKFQAAAEDLAVYWRSMHRSGIDLVYYGKVVKSAYYSAMENIRSFEVFLAKLKVQKFMKGIDFEKLTAEELETLQKAFKQGVAEFDAATPAFSVEVKYASGTSQLTIGKKGELLLDGKAVGRTEREEVFKQLGLSHANRGHGALRDPLTIANEALQNAAKPKGAGMSSIFASDEKMLRSLEAARVEVAAGRGVKSGASTLVDLPVTPDTGRVFVARSHIPAGAKPVSAQPFTSLPDVAELPVTHVRALFSETSPGVFKIEDIFPAFKP